MCGVSGEDRHRIVLADRHALVRDGVRRILETDERLSIVAEAGTGPDVVKAVGQGGVCLLISGVVMPGMTGLQALRSLRSRRLDAPTAFLTSSTKECHLREAMELDARAYLHKSIDSGEFLRCCQRVLGGERLLDSNSVTAMLDRWRPSDPGRATLTAREKEVVALVAEGLVNDAIAERLYLSVKTVERHRSNILTKLGLHSGVELCRYAIRTGLVEA